jgi:hypothetical protein
MTNLFDINTALPRWWWLNPWKACLILRQRIVAITNLSSEKVREMMSYRHMAIQKDVRIVELEAALDKARDELTKMKLDQEFGFCCDKSIKKPKPAKRKRKTK